MDGLRGSPKIGNSASVAAMNGVSCDIPFAAFAVFLVTPPLKRRHCAATQTIPNRSIPSAFQQAMYKVIFFSLDFGSMS